MEDCVFCKIVAGTIPSDAVYRDDRVLAFRDIHPAAPVHILIIPMEHITGVRDIDEAKAGLLGHMMMVANKLAKDNGVAERGYRLVINSGPEGGQVVPHLHMHLLGGRPLQERMG